MLDAVKALKDLIRIDTTNPPGDEMRALRHIAGLLEGSRVEVGLQPFADGRRGNLVARLAGADGRARPLVFLSHVDVVPANGEGWRFPPFMAQEQDGYIYGRGAVDTKQLTVMELAAFLSLAGEGAPDRDVYLVATGDEERGSELGLKALLSGSVILGGREAAGRAIFQGALVISEGGGFPVQAGGRTLYLVETGQKGVGRVTFTFREPGGVYLTGTGALRRAAGLVRELHETRLESRATRTLQTFEGALCRACDCPKERLNEHLTPMLASILSAMRVNTLTPTLIEGPGLKEAAVTCDARLLPGFGRPYLEEVAGPLARKWGAEFSVDSFSEGYESEAGGEISALYEALVRELGPEGTACELVPFLSMGSSDGRFLKPLGASVYGFSPVLGWDMTFDQAVRMVHGVDERIHRDSLQFGCRVLTRAARRLTGAAEGEP
jgi:acetylornithine deacetylase/succinyl-diaminopimelate desuccinylase-like protein